MNDVTDTKNTETAPHHAMRQRRSLFSFDLLPGASFLAAIGISFAALAHNIRDRFYHGFIHGFRESKTAFTPIIEKYTNRNTGLFSKNATELQQGKKTYAEYVARNHDIVKDYRKEIFGFLEKNFNIPTYGFKGWTVGTWKRFKEIGESAGVASTLTFASIAATSFGAIMVLQRNRDSINRVEDKIDAGRGR